MPGCELPPTGFLKLLTWVDLSKGRSVREQTQNLKALRAAVRGKQIAASALRASICPYRGLEPFREEDAAFFCGRDEAIRELVARVQQHSFVAVVGPSGSGKSSLVFAGLLPALRKQGGTTMWDVVTLRRQAAAARTRRGVQPSAGQRLHGRDRRVARRGSRILPGGRRGDAEPHHRPAPGRRAGKAGPPANVCRSVGGALRDGAAARRQGAPRPAFRRCGEVRRASGRSVGQDSRATSSSRCEPTSTIR